MEPQFNEPAMLPSSCGKIVNMQLLTGREWPTKHPSLMKTRGERHSTGSLEIVKSEADHLKRALIVLNLLEFYRKNNGALCKLPP